MNPNQAPLNRITASSMWAAYGDALGFITELASAETLYRRTKLSVIKETIPWRRLIGGKFGTEAHLPAGTYSDDTQLRLATSRSIRADGKFDVEAFAKIELPVWLSYSLGAGRGTKAAAANLASPNVNWFSNFYLDNDHNYFHGGGNGAAMRIQPHVWSAKDPLQPDLYIVDVIKNSICTHGHLRGILGAVFHALSLGLTLGKRAIPSPNEWRDIVEYFPSILKVFSSDHELRSFWLPTWESKSDSSFQKGIFKVIDECNDDLRQIDRALKQNTPINQYRAAIESTDAFSDLHRGSGIKTAMLACALSWIYKDETPEKMLGDSANVLSSDTDTISSMAGAIRGACIEYPPKNPVLDSTYIEFEARRMFEIQNRHKTYSFSYPDLFGWQAPKSQQDALGKFKDQHALSGLGVVILTGEIFKSKSKSEGTWEWVKSDFGQSMLVKRRSLLNQIEATVLPPNMTGYDMSFKNQNTEPDISHHVGKRESAIREKAPLQSDLFGLKEQKSIHDLTDDVIRSGFDPHLIGEYLLDLCNRRDGIEKSIAFASIVAKARIARKNAERGKNS